MLCYLKYAAAGLAAATLVSGQTYTDCNPMKSISHTQQPKTEHPLIYIIETCPANPGTTESRHTFDFTQSSGLDKWTTTAGNVKTGSNGAEFTVNKKGDAPTIKTDFYMFFGEVSVTMKAAPGTGIVSSIVLESDDLDEIDWVNQHTHSLTQFIYLTSIPISGSRWRRHDPNRVKLLRKRRYHDLRPRNLAPYLVTPGDIPNLQSRLDQRIHHLVR